MQESTLAFQGGSGQGKRGTCKIEGGPENSVIKINDVLMQYLRTQINAKYPQ
jgi:hypothetical protein